jgi:hypothetical protein
MDDLNSIHKKAITSASEIHPRNYSDADGIAKKLDKATKAYYELLSDQTLDAE